MSTFSCIAEAYNTCLCRPVIQESYLYSTISHNISQKSTPERENIISHVYNASQNNAVVQYNLGTIEGGERRSKVYKNR